MTLLIGTYGSMWVSANGKREGASRHVVLDGRVELVEQDHRFPARGDVSKLSPDVVR